MTKGAIGRALSTADIYLPARAVLTLRWHGSTPCRIHSRERLISALRKNTVQPAHAGQALANKRAIGLGQGEVKACGSQAGHARYLPSPFECFSMADSRYSLDISGFRVEAPCGFWPSEWRVFSFASLIRSELPRPERGGAFLAASTENSGWPANIGSCGFRPGAGAVGCTGEPAGAGELAGSSNGGNVSSGRASLLGGAALSNFLLSGITVPFASRASSVPNAQTTARASSRLRHRRGRRQALSK